MSTIQMFKSNAGEVMHLFEVMARHGVSCSLEMNVEGSADPILGIADATNLSVEYVEGDDGDTVVVNLDNAELAFELQKNTFGKYISDCQVMISIISDDRAAWFNSSAMSPEAIQEAKSYDSTGGEFEDKEVILNHSNDMVNFHEEMKYLNQLLDEGRNIKRVDVTNGEQKITLGYESNPASYTLIKLDNYELALLKIVRSLKFDDMLDASNGLELEAEGALIAARQCKESNPNASVGFEQRAENLRVLAEILPVANADYREHCEME